MTKRKVDFFERRKEAERLIEKYGDRAYYEARAQKQLAIHDRNRKAVDFYGGVVREIERLQPARFVEGYDA